MEQFATLKPRRKKWTGAVVRIMASVLVLAIVLQLIDLDAARDGLARLSIGVWLVSLAMFLALHAAAAMKWRHFIVLSGARIGARDALTCHAVGLFANLCLPSLIGGDVLRAGFAVPKTRSGEAVIVAAAVDRIADLTALLLLVVVGLALEPGAISRLTGALVSVQMLIGVAVVLAFGACLAIRIVFRRRPIRQWPRRVARRLIETLRALRALAASPSRAVVGLASSAAIQTGFVLVNVRLGHAVGLDLDIGLWFLLWPLAKIAAMMPLSFGGLGVREAAFAALVAPFANESLAVVQSLVWQSALVAGGLLSGLFFLGVHRRHDDD